MTDRAEDEYARLHQHAYDAMDRGDLGEASRAFGQLLEHAPENPGYHYMRGLAHKYQLDWPVSLEHNLRAIALADQAGEAERWNAAIAATALGDWSQARLQWQACGIRISEGDGPIAENFGVAVVRLNPWHGGETVFMRRIDPVRARLLNVPLPESGHRFGDIVLHDGAATGHRFDGERKVPVFNELARLVPSDFQTFVVFAGCATAADLEALVDASLPGIGYIEDWTRNIAHYCLRCSHGTPHRHTEGSDGTWQPDRNLGIAAQSRHSVEKLLQAWSAAAPGRRIDAIEMREHAAPPREEGGVWWRGPEDDPAEEESSAEAWLRGGAAPTPTPIRRITRSARDPAVRCTAGRPA